MTLKRMEKMHYDSITHNLWNKIISPNRMFALSCANMADSHLRAAEITDPWFLYLSCRGERKSK